MDREYIDNRAKDLRTQLARINETEKEQKRGLLSAFKIEAFGFLQELGLPRQVLLLIAESWASTATRHGRKGNGAENLIDALLPPRDSPAFLAAVAIEAATPGLGKKALASRLRAALGTTTDYNGHIQRWRKQDRYKHMVKIASWEHPPGGGR